VQHTHLAVKAKFLLDLVYWFTPWLSCSFGAGINKASSFSSTPRIFEAVPTPSFDTHTLTSFTYTVGAGIQKPLDEHWQLGIGYEFADWGKNRLAQGPYQIYNTGLSIDNFYTNSILLNITYISEGV
jgi:opacity protein-like surface antigen